MNPFSAYIGELEQALQRGDATEHTHRPALKALIEAIAPDVTVTNEPKRITCGAPDYNVSRGPVPLGHIEAKDIGKPLDKEANSQQLIAYRDSLSNLILTDYIEFRWFVEGEWRLTRALGEIDRNGKIHSDKNAIQAVEQLLDSFLKQQTPTVTSPKDLAIRMAGLARLIREVITLAVKSEDQKGGLHLQLRAFRKVLLHDLADKDFANMYAQTIAYGLFAARCNHTYGERFTRERAGFELPKTNPFLRQLFSHIAGPDYIRYDRLGRVVYSTKLTQIRIELGEKSFVEVYNWIFSTGTSAKIF